MKKRNKPVIPGFGLSMGITISILSLVVLIPLASLVVYTAKLSFKDIIENSAICEMFLLHFIPSAIIIDICQIYIQIKRITVLLQDFLIGGAEIILCCDLLCFDQIYER